MALLPGNHCSHRLTSGKSWRWNYGEPGNSVAFPQDLFLSHLVWFPWNWLYEVHRNIYIPHTRTEQIITLFKIIPAMWLEIANTGQISSPLFHHPPVGIPPSHGRAWKISWLFRSYNDACPVHRCCSQLIPGWLLTMASHLACICSNSAVPAKVSAWKCVCSECKITERHF